jgi:hypothetical protein
MPTKTAGLHDVVMKAKEMQLANRRERIAAGDVAGLASWAALPDCMKLSWFREAAAELGVEL